MILVFRAAPRRCTNFTFLPSRCLPSPLHFSCIPLIHQSYHAALPCSLNKSSFIPSPPFTSSSLSLHLFLPPLPVSCLRLLSDASCTRLFFLYLLRPIPPICNDPIWHYSITLLNTFPSESLHFPQFDCVLIPVSLWPECVDNIKVSNIVTASRGFSLLDAVSIKVQLGEHLFQGKTKVHV